MGTQSLVEVGPLHSKTKSLGCLWFSNSQDNGHSSFPECCWALCLLSLPELGIFLDDSITLCSRCWWCVVCPTLDMWVLWISVLFFFPNTYYDG